MKVDDITQSEATAGVLLPCQPCAPPRILVVDDEPAIRHVMPLSLVQSGYHVDAAEDGEAAWQALQAKHYDLLITDHSMPKVTGVALVKMVRARDMSLPVVLISGQIPTEDLERHPWLRISAILPKPFALDALRDTVKNVLSAPTLIL